MSKSLLRKDEPTCWGIDISTRVIAFGIAPDQITRTLSVGAEPGARRLSAAYDAIRRYSANLAEVHPPTVVWVEQPMGTHRNPSLDHMTGVVMAALYAGLHDHYGKPCPIWFINISDWKKGSVGFANANKLHVLEWAQDKAGLETDHLCDNPRGCKHIDHDRADSLGVAYAGLSLMNDPGSIAA